jgi:hypothetical protein
MIPTDKANQKGGFWTPEQQKCQEDFDRAMRDLKEREEFAKDSMTKIPPHHLGLITSNKPWADLAVAEQVERLHEVVKDLQRTVQAQREWMEHLKDRERLFLQHSHADGKVVGPIFPQPYNQGACAKINTEGYF